ncbi:ATP-dependent Clp protease ATP-binding subunit CLPT1, chloroplastic-like protein [Drosera capensis]
MGTIQLPICPINQFPSLTPFKWHRGARKSSRRSASWNEIEVSKENLAKWSASAMKSFSLAELEAVKLKYPDTGTEAILLGILVEGMSFASKFLRSHGITFFKAQQAALDLLGKSHLSYYPPKQPPLTEPALKVLDMAVDLKQKSGKSGEVTPSHLLLALWALEASAGHKILENLGFNDDKAKELANSILIH